MPPAVLPITMPVLRAQGQSLALDAAPVPTCPDDGALVKLTAVGLCGSDVEKLTTGKAQAGQILGHEVVGKLVSVGPKAPCDRDGLPWQVGQRVVTSHHVPCGNQDGTCRYCTHGAESMCEIFKASNLAPGGFAQYFAVTAQHLQHTVFAIPDDVSVTRASAMEPLACVAKGVRRASALTGPLIHTGDTVMIIGLGYIGLLAAIAYRATYGPSLRLVGVDRSNERCALAPKLLGASVLDEILTSDAAEQKVTDSPLAADQVFVSVVMEPTVNLALAHVRNGGVVVPFSRAVDDVAAFGGNALYYREIAVMPSYSPNLSDLKQSAAWIFSGQANVEGLVTHTCDFDSANDGLMQYRNGQAVKVLLTP